MTGRDKRAAPQTTLKQKGEILTTNLQGTIHHMLQIFTPEDNQEDDTELQKKTGLYHKKKSTRTTSRSLPYRELRTW